VEVFCWVAQTKSVLSDGCLDDIVIAEILLFEGIVRFYSDSGVSEVYMEYVQKTAIRMKWFNQECSVPCIHR
jgi:hypothetical protein